MSRQLTQEEVVLRFRAAHGDKYGYDNVIYRGRNIDVNIECPIHGIFQQQPAHHWNGSGCLKCANNVKRKSMVYGVGINDVEERTRTTSYKTWKGMLCRCYYEKKRPCYPTYADCSVCEEWLTYSNFKKWFDENYIEGYDLDKDILFKGNKIYSPHACRFVPHEINSILLNRKRNRGILPIGVSKYRSRFVASMTVHNKSVYFGVFPTPEEAFQAYKVGKESHIKEVATAYYNRGEIDYDIYQSLMNWTIEITD